MSHLVTALGLQACERATPCCSPAPSTPSTPSPPPRPPDSFKRDLRRYLRPRLLILDELGYLPIDKTGADLLRSSANDTNAPRSRSPPIAYSNDWPEIFNHDAKLTSAVLDRLLHHGETVILEGNSFRMKDVIDN